MNVLSVLYVPPALCSPGFVLHLLAASLGAVSLVQTQTSFLSLTLLVAGVERERKLKLLLKLYPLWTQKVFVKKLNLQDMGVTHGKKVSLFIFFCLYFVLVYHCWRHIEIIQQKHPCGKNTFLACTVSLRGLRDSNTIKKKLIVTVCSLNCAIINDMFRMNCLFLFINLSLCLAKFCSLSLVGLSVIVVFTVYFPECLHQT